MRVLRADEDVVEAPVVGGLAKETVDLGSRYRVVRGPRVARSLARHVPGVVVRRTATAERLHPSEEPDARRVGSRIEITGDDRRQLTAVAGIQIGDREQLILADCGLVELPRCRGKDDEKLAQPGDLYGRGYGPPVRVGVGCRTMVEDLHDPMRPARAQYGAVGSAGADRSRRPDESCSGARHPRSVLRADRDGPGRRPP